MLSHRQPYRILMLNSWTCLLILCTLTALSFSLPTSLNKDAKKTDQMRIKREQHHPIESNKNFVKDITKFVSLAKRAQETLMFGNQQNRQPENRGNPYVSSTEKRALNAAGLDSLKMSFTKENKFPNAKSPRNSLDERNVYNPHDNKNYEYGKVIVTEEGDEIPQVSDVASYTRYYMNDDRRKRLEKFIPNIHTTTVPPSCTEYHMPYPTQNSPIQTKKRLSFDTSDAKEVGDSGGVMRKRVGKKGGRDVFHGSVIVRKAEWNQPGKLGHGITAGITCYIVGQAADINTQLFFKLFPLSLNCKKVLCLLLYDPFSIPIYAEPRYKREVEIHPEPVWNLLSMWGNGHRNRLRFITYTNEEYDNEEDGDLIEDEDPRNALAWMNAPGYSSYRYGTDTLPPSEIGIVHTHPSAYYDQYENQYGQQFDNGVHPYINQYGSLYSQDSYYPTERKYITAKKRTPSYDSYINVVPLQMGIRPRVYPPYPHHMVY
ncbi:hypothetical protein M0804_003952 [Polistes exclamans]|nr:hypothetical protein M0804_003952 [Polistes exclamans]